MKPLSESKTRLSPHISPERRAALSLDMLSWVVGVLGESRVERVVVIGGDDVVRSASLAGGAEWMADEYLDLNKAVLHVFETAWRDGKSAAYLPADLPLLTASDVDGAIEASSDGAFLTICPAHDGGTNGLIAPPGIGFYPRLGSDSFARHKELADELGIEMRERRSAGFDRDVDTIDDLLDCVRMGAPCLENYTEIAREVNE